MTTLQMSGEHALIRHLVRSLPTRADVRVGPGDDAAVVKLDAKTDLVLKADAVVEGVHFAAEDAAPRVGHKALARVLSDFAAMGATPEYALVSLAAPPGAALARCRGIYAGLARTAKRHGVAVVGGETVRATDLSLHVFAAGRVPRGKAVRRIGARPGDVLFVTGALGGSRAGHHLDFAPRVREGAWLRAGGWATSMIDLSDGLATDLRHLAEASGVGADLDPARIPISLPARQSADGVSALNHALADGEDFELLFTVRRGQVGRFIHAWARAFKTPCTAIGAITARRGRILLRPVGGKASALAARGYQHFG